MKHISTFKNLISNPVYGGKANKLSEMVQYGIPVPDGFVLLPEAFDFFLENNKELLSAIDEFIEHKSFASKAKLSGKFDKSIFPDFLVNELESAYFELTKTSPSVAVRSSGAMEDGTNASFAGQFETYLNIKSFEDLTEAVKKCWFSLFGDKVIAYSENKGLKISDYKMSVVIQQFVDSDFSGVVFTANPMTGNDKQMVVEVVSGLGEALVQGSTIPDLYHYDWYNENIEVVKFGEQNFRITSDENGGVSNSAFSQVERLLADDEIARLCSVCLDVQRFYGEPLDIEWAIKNGEVFILQARPLTSIHFKVDYEWTTADLKDGGITSSNTTPMMFSLYEYIFENTMPAYFKMIKILPKRKFDKWFNWWFGYSYWNMLGAKEGVKQIPGFIERNFDKSLGIEPDYEGDGHKTKFTPKSILKGIQILMATNKSIAKRSGECKKDIGFAKKYFEEIEDICSQKPELQSLINFFEELIRIKYLHLEGSYFFTIYDNSNAATFCQEAIDKANKKNAKKINYLNLVSGLSNLSHMRPTYDLWEIFQKIKHDEMAFEFYKYASVGKLTELINSNSPFFFTDELKGFIQKYRYHSIRELDITVPNWDEDPTQPIELLLNFIHNPEIPDPKESLKKQNRLYHTEKQYIKTNSLNKKLSAHRHLLWWREEMRDYSSKMYFHIRRVLLLLGDSMVERKLIENRNDVFFLKFMELIDFAKSENLDYQKIITKNQIFYQSFRNFKNPNEIWQKRDFTLVKNATIDGKYSWSGIGGSHGHAIARAVVIDSIFEADKIEKGDILVTKFTDPAWTIYFARIAGLVTESGGMLSHGAVVSREYGIPAILGIRDITNLIKTGNMIEIDGDLGVVNIIR